MGSKWTVYVGNDAAGADTNLAALNFHNAEVYSGIPTAANVARLCAYMQYLLPAANTYIKTIEVGADLGGGQFPAAFPTAAYATLASADSNLVAMSAYGVRYGFNALTALGSGAVISRRTAVTGRSGRGRLTTPWLPTTAVETDGSLLVSSQGVPVTGWALYMDSGAFQEQLRCLGNTLSRDLTSISVSSRIGRTRSRTK